eukprot:sb/3476485/
MIGSCLVQGIYWDIVSTGRYKEVPRIEGVSPWDLGISQEDPIELEKNIVYPSDLRRVALRRKGVVYICLLINPPIVFGLLSHKLSKPHTTRKPTELPTDTSKQPIRTHYLGHVTDY